MEILNVLFPQRKNKLSGVGRIVPHGGLVGAKEIMYASKSSFMIPLKEQRLWNLVEPAV